MSKLILLSVVLVSVAVPIYFSSRSAPRAALKRTQWIIIGFVVVWAFLCIVLYPKLQPLE